MNEDTHDTHAMAKTLIGQLYVIRSESPLYREREVLEKEVEFFQTGLFPLNLESSKKYGFVRRATKHTLLGDVLFMKVVDVVLRSVPWKEEIYRILEENHEGSSGGHFDSKIILNKILQEGYV